MSVKRSRLRSADLAGILATGILIAAVFIIPLAPLAVDKKLSSSYLDQLDNSIAVVFFGFRACSDTCPMTLSRLRSTYSAIDRSHKPDIVFIDIDQASNSLNATNYARAFHKAFIGLHPSREELSKLDADFGLNLPGNTNLTGHQGKTYLIKKKQNTWKIVRAIDSRLMASTKFSLINLINKEFYR